MEMKTSTKERIFETALDLFSENGFAATSIRMITKKTGITVASFYNHFESKDQLLQEVYEYYRKLYIDSADLVAQYGELLDKLGPAGLFRHLTLAFVESMRNEKLAKLSRIIVMEQYTSKTAGEIVHRDQQKLLASMEEMFVLMNQKGMIRVEDARSTGRLVGYAFLGFTADSIHHNIKQEDLDRVVESQIGLITQFIKEIS